MKFPRQNIYVMAEIACLCLALASGCVLGWGLFGPEQNFWIICIAGGFFTLFLMVMLALLLDPDRVRARQSMSVLELASATLQAMHDGLTMQSAQRVCEVLYPTSAASAIAITDTEVVLGYYGAGKEMLGETGGAIRTAATRATIKDGKTRVLLTSEEVGLPNPVRGINAAIIVPLKVGDVIRGTLKFYYPSSSRLNATQRSIAEGFAQLISTQIAATELEDQKKLATSMELKALQSQINPHFLFNIINTMASLVRTDPEKARIMLREFAVFYRQTLENSSDLIPLAREVEQTVRYLSLEQARFGEERLAVETKMDDDVLVLLVPTFMIQPLVENSVKHAMPAEGQLLISIAGEIRGDDVYIYVHDNGVGMTEKALANIMNPESQTGLGIAVKNVNDRLRGYYGPDSYMDVQSVLGEGTQVTLFLKDCAILQY